MALLCVELNLSMRPEKFPLLLINPDRHDIPLPDRGEKSSDERDGESNGPLFFGSTVDIWDTFWDIEKQKVLPNFF